MGWRGREGGRLSIASEALCQNACSVIWRWGAIVAAAKSKLQMVGKDLNALDAGEAQLSADAAAAGQKQELDLHAIATLDRRDATLQKQLSAARAAVQQQFSAEEHQALIDNSNTVRAIAPKIKSVLAKEEVRPCKECLRVCEPATTIPCGRFD